MSGCTAPSDGHRTASGAANCPVHRGGRGYFRSTYSSYSSFDDGNYGGSRSVSGGSSGSTSRRTRSGRSVPYTPSEWRAVQPYAEKAAAQAQAYPDKRDLFLCHAWDDRESSARELHGHLRTSGATVWFSQDDIPLGSLQSTKDSSLDAVAAKIAAAAAALPVEVA